MRKWPLFLAATGFCCALIARSGAQIVEPPDILPPDAPRRRIFPPRPIFPPPVSTLTELRMENQSAKVEIRGPLASVHLRQTLRNPSDRTLEGTYLFALPTGAAVSNFAMTMGGKRLEAEILDGDKAREIYRGIVQKMRDPAILEFVGRGVARVKVFPVPARGAVAIELDYAQNIAGNRFDLPLRSPQNAGDGSAANSAKSSVEISLQGADLRAVYSPSHQIETRSSGQKTLVSGEFPDSQRDFSLLWTRGQEKIGLDLFAAKSSSEDGTFLLLAAPDTALSSAQIEAKDVVFVFDTSGSMEGAKIEQARRALKTLLGSLGAKDRFGIVTFASASRLFRDDLVGASKTNLDAARAFADEIKALGGTNIADALQSAFKMTRASARPQQVVFLTDGQPTVGEMNIDAILAGVSAQNTSKARLFTFGLGNDVNARLLDGLASDHRGASDYVAPSEDIEVKVGALYEKIAFPVLSNAKIDFGGLSVYDVYPPTLPDLFKGSQATVMGRFRGPLPTNISLSGQSNGQNARFSGRTSSYESGDLPKLWATRKIGFLIEDARRQNRAVEGEVRDEIIKLSQKFGIVTPFTAALITEDGASPSMPSSAPWRAGFGGGIGGGGGMTGMAGNAPAPALRYRASRGNTAGGRMADSGAAGVAASQKTRELREGRAESVVDVKVVAGKTFTLKEGVWTDSEFDVKSLPSAARTVKFASDEYFELIREANLAKWLSVGERVVVVWNGKIIKIEP